MKAIIIEDKDAMALLESLELERFKYFPIDLTISEKINKDDTKFLVEDMHRRFHYVVTRWLQDQGASGIR